MIKYILISLFLISFNCIVKGQTYTHVDKQPEFPGGQEAFAKFISKNVSFTKEDAEKEGAPQTRYIHFTIDSIGTAKNPQIENKEVSKYTDYDKRLMEMVLKMPKWIPAELDKKKVTVTFMFPLRLSLQE
jgi:protein TonB